MLKQGIRALLLTQTSITTLAPAQTVNGVSLPSIFCENAPQGVEPPYILIASSTLDVAATLGSVQSESIVISAVCYSQPAAGVLAKAINTFFDPYKGNVTADGVTDVIQGSYIQDQNYDYVFPSDGRDDKFNSLQTPYNVFYTPG